MYTVKEVGYYNICVLCLVLLPIVSKNIGQMFIFKPYFSYFCTRK